MHLRIARSIMLSLQSYSPESLPCTIGGQMNKYDAYTLWVKYRNVGWRPVITAKTGGRGTISPYSFLNSWAKGAYDGLDYYKRGKTWMIKPEGQKPAGA